MAKQSLGAVGAVVCLSLCAPALAAKLTTSTSSEGKIAAYLSGEIVDGDAHKLATLIRQSKQRGRVVSSIRLNSQGGRLSEGLKLADIIQKERLSTLIGDGEECASACFLAFAAGAKKYISYTGGAGVHGASNQNGEETSEAVAATIGMARAAKELGVPPAVLGKMVTTPPSQIVWLSPEDLCSMGAKYTGRPIQLGDQTIQSAPSCNQTSNESPASYADENPDELIQAEPKQVAKILQSEGYSAKISSDSDGDPLISSSTQGARYIIVFYDCSQNIRCKSIQFSCAFKANGAVSVNQANEWNSSRRFTKAIIDKEGDLWLYFDLALSAGMKRELFVSNLATWNDSLGDFMKDVASEK